MRFKEINNEDLLCLRCNNEFSRDIAERMGYRFYLGSKCHYCSFYLDEINHDLFRSCVELE